jgi:hypothetical protein
MRSKLLDARIDYLNQIRRSGGPDSDGENYKKEIECKKWMFRERATTNMV